MIKSQHPNVFIARLITSLIRNKIRGKVFAGPFCGMRYVDKSIWSAYIPKLLGTYEKEIAPAIEKICLTPFDIIINVGAGEGYYAVGLAIRNPGTKVIAYEALKTGRGLIREMAAMNNVSKQVNVRSACSISSLRSSLKGKGKKLILMDTEGAEFYLLDPRLAPELKNAYILAELHNAFISDMGEVIAKRFRKTHRIKSLCSKPRRINDFPFPVLLKIPLKLRSYLQEAMDEQRGGRWQWLFMTPKTSAKWSPPD